MIFLYRHHKRGATSPTFGGKIYSHSGEAVSSGMSKLILSVRVENLGPRVVCLNDCAELCIFKTLKNIFDYSAYI